MNTETSLELVGCIPGQPDEGAPAWQVVAEGSLVYALGDGDAGLSILRINSDR